jgi:hypothetical protein
MVDHMDTKTDADVDLLPQRISRDADSVSSALLNVGIFFLCFLAAFVSFWDVRLTFDLTRIFSIGWVAVLLYIVTIMVYRTKYDGGVALGKQGETYRNAIEAFSSIKASILSANAVDKLREWCLDLQKKDFDAVRKEIVYPYMDYGEYVEKYQTLTKKQVKASNLSRNAKKAVIQANKIAPAELSSDMLLNQSYSRSLFGKRRILPISGDDRRRSDLLINYVNVFVRTFICGMFVIEIVSDPTLDTFMQWMVRMVPILMALITAPSAGEKNASEIAPRRLTAQTEILKRFSDDLKDGGSYEEEKTVVADCSGDSNH